MEWISTKDKLPKTREQVLIIRKPEMVFTENNYGRSLAVFVEHYEDEHGIGKNIFIGKSKEGRAVFLSAEYEVSHWASLPDVPEEFKQRFPNHKQWA